MLAAWSVVHVIVAPVLVGVATTAEITGAVVEALVLAVLVVVKLLSADMFILLLASIDITW